VTAGKIGYADAATGKTVIKSHNYDKAVDDYNIAIRLKPDNPRAFYGRGVAYFCLEEYDKVISHLTKAIELKPDYGNAYWVRGDAKRFLKRVGYCEDYLRASRLHVSDAMEAWKKNCQ